MTELLRFYEDLGIIANRGSAVEHNDNLQQGQQFMEHRRYNNRHVKVDRIEEGFSTLTENMDNPPPPPLNIFNEMDTNKDGKISREELDKWFMAKYKMNAPAVLFEQADVNKDNYISWDEFKWPKGNSPPVPVSVTAPTAPVSVPEPVAPNASSHYSNIFNEMDTNKDGKISKEESDNWFMKKHNIKAPSGLFEKTDVNKDNYLSLNELIEENNKINSSASVPNAPAPTSQTSTTTTKKTSDLVSSSAPLQSNLPNKLDYTNSVNNTDSEVNLDATTFLPVNADSKTIEGRRDDSILETKSIKYHYIAWIFFTIFIIWAIFSISAFSFSGININSEFQPAQNETNVFSMFVILILIVIVIMVFRQFNSTQIKTTVSVYDSSKDNGNGNGNANGKNGDSNNKK